MSLWTSADAAQATGGESTMGWTASGVSIDTRTLQKGDLFVALKDVRDGHDFVVQALASGAAAALVTHIPKGAEGMPLLIVNDVLKALEDLAKAARNRTNAKFIAVTGSVGKTGTKEMLRTALAGQGRVHAAEKSYNNHWGVPLTLARMPVDTDYAILEIGMNHAGEIGPLSRLVRPDVGVITNVAAVHMEAFKTVDEIAVEKAAIVEGIAAGTVVLNADLTCIDLLKAETKTAKTITFGSNLADFHLQSVNLKSQETEVVATANGTQLNFTVGGVGTHQAMNALATLAAVDAIGADVEGAALALKNWRPPTGRGARWDVDGIQLIDDSYNANPLSIASALDVLASVKGQKIAILGDMLELGPTEITLHQNIAEFESIGAVDVIHCVGPRMQHLYDALPPEKRGRWLATSIELVPLLPEILKSGDVVMVKGSLGAKMGLIVDAIKNLGDAREMNEIKGEA